MQGHTGKAASSSPSPHSTSMDRDKIKPTAPCLAYRPEYPLHPTAIWEQFMLSPLPFPQTLEGHEQELLKKSSTSQACSRASVPAARSRFPPRSPETALSVPCQPRRWKQGKGTSKGRKEKSNAAAGQWDSIFKSNLGLRSQWGRNATICMTTAKWTE